MYGDVLPPPPTCMVHPGEQNPHWDPLLAASAIWMGWYPRLRDPMPSGVSTLQPSMDARGRRHAFTAPWDTLPATASQRMGSCLRTIASHAETMIKLQHTAREQL